MTLMKPLMSKGRNVTTDNYFTLFLLAKELKTKKAGLVQTMNKVRLELPASAKRSQERYSSKLTKTGDRAISTVYQCEPKKNVCVLSSLHMSVELGESEKKKPEKMEFYNKSKCDVDVANQMARQCSVKAGTRWWPVAVFYNILGLAGINAFVLHKKQTGDKISRRDFLFKFTTELREDYIVEDQAETLLLLNLTNYRHLLKTPKPRSLNNVK